MIDEKSMQCTFSMKQPGKDAEQVFSVACNEKMLNNALFSTYYKNYWDVAFGNYYINLKQIFDDNSQFDNDLFGEYKIRLDRVDYRYCAYDEDEDDYERKDTELDNVCETNFTVTKPYLVQKSAFGLTPKATTINLDDFYDINGDKLIKRTDLEDVMILDSNDYKISNITNLTKTFLDKYNKLAIANKYLPKQLQ
ncbi:TPA: hypothetical protein DEP21_02875 [Patescibacteria group bacterium]|nr:hypothetical protein [Candidatus Gracilibacteria bacterium]